MALDSPEVREYFRKNVPHMAKTLQGTFGLTDDSTQKAKKNRMHRDAQESSDIMVEERRREIREEQQATPSKFPKQPKVYELVHFIEKGRDDPGLTAMKPGKTKSHMAMGSFFGEPRYFSTANLDDLTRISLDEMETWKQHRGRYLLCRIVSKPSLGVSVVVADPNGDGIILDIHHTPILPICLGLPTQKDIDATFAFNSVLAIKEPTTFVQEKVIAEERVFIRVDAPTDVVWLDHKDPKVEEVQWMRQRADFEPMKYDFPQESEKNLMAWKKQGNTLYSNRRYIEALQAYSAGIKQHPAADETYLLFLNRAAVNLTLERYSDSMSDAKTASFLLRERSGDAEKDTISLKEKAQLRIAKSYYGLGCWVKAKQEFDTCLKQYPQSEEAKKGLEKSLQRIVETTTGRYDWLGLYLAAQKEQRPRLDAAEDIGPVQVKHVKGKGRGLVVAKDVKAGTLLLVSKALDCLYPEDLADREGIATYDLETDKLDTQCGARLSTSLIYRLYHDPTLAARVQHLCRGPKRTSTEAVVELASKQGSNLLPSGSVPIDTTLVDDLVTYSTQQLHALFDGDDFAVAKAGQKLAKVMHSYGGGGLWGPVSMINHDCVPNTRSYTIGDVYVVRAIDDLPAGTEITITYSPHGGTGGVSQERDLNRWLGRVCTCKQCIADDVNDKAGKEQRMKLLNARLRNTSIQAMKVHTGSMENPGPEDNLASLEKLVQDLNETYSASYNGYKVQVADYQIIIGQQVLFGFKPVQFARLWGRAIQYGKQALRNFGISLREDKSVTNGKGGKEAVKQTAPDGLCVLNAPKLMGERAITCMLQIAGLYKYLRDKQAEKDWVLAAYWTDRVITSDSKELFKERYKVVLKTLNAKAIDEVKW